MNFRPMTVADLAQCEEEDAKSKEVSKMYKELMTPNSQNPEYSMFPNFLYKFKVSPMAKVLYTLLFNRARLSMRNKKWIDRDNHVFCIYKTKDIAKELGTTERWVVRLLEELESKELILRKRQRNGLPNLIYPIMWREEKVEKNAREMNDHSPDHMNDCSPDHMNDCSPDHMNDCSPDYMNDCSPDYMNDCSLHTYKKELKEKELKEKEYFEKELKEKECQHSGSGAERDSKNFSETDERFDEFWRVYPKKIAKPNAKKAWDELQPDTSLFEKIMTSLKASLNSEGWQKENGRYIPYPAKWLSEERWNDEVEPITSAKQNFTEDEKKDTYAIFAEAWGWDK